MGELVMPKFGLTMTEGLLSEWHVAAGSDFVAGQLLYTVETEKVANEVEATADGTLLEILVATGDTVAVGTPIARVSGAGSKVTKGDGPPPVEAAAISPGDAPAPHDPPSVRKLLAENGLDRAGIESTGRAGRLTKGDVLRVLATPLAKRVALERGIDLAAVQGSGPRGRVKLADVEAARRRAPPPVSAGLLPVTTGLREIVPSAARLATARRVTASKRDIPHFYVTHEAELGPLTQLREQLNASGASLRISVTHMLLRAVGLTLAEMPALNRIWSGDKIVAFDQVAVGMVTETPDGLRIPVLRNVDGTSLDDLARLAVSASDRARQGKLTNADVGDSVASVSNVGMFGVSSLTPILNPPNAMIVGVGAVRQTFRPDAAGQPALRNELTLTLACDHRIIDGADAARFLSHLVAMIEQPIRLLRDPRKISSES